MKLALVLNLIFSVKEVNVYNFMFLFFKVYESDY